MFLYFIGILLTAVLPFHFAAGAKEQPDGNDWCWMTQISKDGVGHQLHGMLSLMALHGVPLDQNASTSRKLGYDSCIQLNKTLLKEAKWKKSYAHLNSHQAHIANGFITRVNQLFCERTKPKPTVLRKGSFKAGRRPKCASQDKWNARRKGGNTLHRTSVEGFLNPSLFGRAIAKRYCASDEGICERQKKWRGFCTGKNMSATKDENDENAEECTLCNPGIFVVNQPKRKHCKHWCHASELCGCLAHLPVHKALPDFKCKAGATALDNAFLVDPSRYLAPAIPRLAPMFLEALGPPPARFNSTTLQAVFHIRASEKARSREGNVLAHKLGLAIIMELHRRATLCNRPISITVHTDKKGVFTVASLFHVHKQDNHTIKLWEALQDDVHLRTPRTPIMEVLRDMVYADILLSGESSLSAFAMWINPKAILRLAPLLGDFHGKGATRLQGYLPRDTLSFRQFLTDKTTPQLCGTKKTNSNGKKKDMDKGHH